MHSTSPKPLGPFAWPTPRCTRPDTTASVQSSPNDLRWALPDRAAKTPATTGLPAPHTSTILDDDIDWIEEALTRAPVPGAATSDLQHATTNRSVVARSGLHGVNAMRWLAATMAPAAGGDATAAVVQPTPSLAIDEARRKRDRSASLDTTFPRDRTTMSTAASGAALATMAAPGTRHGQWVANDVASPSTTPSAATNHPSPAVDDDFERWFDDAVRQLPPNATAPRGTASRPAAAVVDIIDLTGNADKRHGVQTASARRAATATRHARRWLPNHRGGPEKAQRLETFRRQVENADYDTLITARDPDATFAFRELWMRLGHRLDPTMTGRSITCTVHQFIFAPVMEQRPAVDHLTAPGVLGHLDALSADARTHIQSRMDVALSLAKAGKTTSFGTISKAMCQRDAWGTLPIYRPEQPYDLATLRAIRATPGDNIEPPDAAVARSRARGIGR